MNRIQRMIAACTAVFRKEKDSGIKKDVANEAKESYQYSTFGTCSKSIDIEIIGNTVTKVHFNGGCPGALSTIATMIAGSNIDELIAKFHGIRCRNDTSCPDQLARALIQIQEKRGK